MKIMRTLLLGIQVIAGFSCIATVHAAGQYIVTASGSNNVTISSSTVQMVNSGTPVSFTVTASPGYTRSNTVGGTCPQGDWSGNTYVLSAVTANCSAIFNVSSGTVRYSAPPGNGTPGHAGTLKDPYQTLWENFAAARPGDTVYLLAGTYNQCPYFKGGGVWGNPIIITGDGTAPAKGAATVGGTTINCTSSVTGAFQLIPTYVTIRNLTIGPAPSASAGLYASSYGSSTCHHLLVDHVTIHDISGSGFQSILCGGLTLTNSLVYNNGLTYTTFCTNGISLAANIDDGTGYYGNQVNGNVSYGNGNPPNCGTPATGYDSDGNGIIVDYGPGTPCASFGSIPSGFRCATTSRTRITNNLVYNNQNAGIVSFNGSNTDIVNNTLYHNQTVATRQYSSFAEIEVTAMNTSSHATSVNIANNVIVPNSTNAVIMCTYLTKVAIFNNVVSPSNSGSFSSNSNCVSPTSSGNITSDPAFVSPTTANFQLQASSPARNMASVLNNANVLLNIDFTGALRNGNAWDAGACEYQASPLGACQGH